MTLSEQMAAYGVTSLWNVTHLDNLESLLSLGILCKNSACQLANVVDISAQRVQNRRRPMFDPRLNFVFDPHAHVPLFFADNTPMLYVTSDDRRVILLELDPQVADAPNVCFSDGNIAATNHCLYTSPDDLGNLDWHVIRSPYPAYWTEWKHKRAAEVLIPGSCSPSFFKNVHVQYVVVDGVRVAEQARTIIAGSDYPHLPVCEDLTPQGVR